MPFVEVATADFEWLTLMVGALEGGSFRGREGHRSVLQGSRKTWEEMRIVIEELRDLGGRVLVLGQLEARRRASGARVNTPIGIVTDFRGCKMSRSLGYFDHGEALRAVGLAH